jgi:hypothetical protein
MATIVTLTLSAGIYPQIPLGLAWNSGNIGGSLKRGTGIAMQVMGGNCGGIISAYVYLTPDSPRFIKGHSILIGFVGYVLKRLRRLDQLMNNVFRMAFFLTMFMSIWCRVENARRDKITREAGVEELTEEQKAQEQEMADSVPWFRYTV